MRASPFLKLPIELRLQVAIHALQPPTIEDAKGACCIDDFVRRYDKFRRQLLSMPEFANLQSLYPRALVVGEPMIIITMQSRYYPSGDSTDYSEVHMLRPASREYALRDSSWGIALQSQASPRSQIRGTIRSAAMPPVRSPLSSEIIDTSSLSTLTVMIDTSALFLNHLCFTMLWQRWPNLRYIKAIIVLNGRLAHQSHLCNNTLSTNLLDPHIDPVNRNMASSFVARRIATYASLAVQLRTVDLELWGGIAISQTTFMRHVDGKGSFTDFWSWSKTEYRDRDRALFAVYPRSAWQISSIPRCLLDAIVMFFVFLHVYGALVVTVTIITTPQQRQHWMKDPDMCWVAPLTGIFPTVGITYLLICAVQSVAELIGDVL